MDQISYKTTYVNKATAQKEWVLIDAENQVVGRLAAKVAKLLRGKYKPSYTPHVDCGDNVIIINVEKVIFTGNKLTDKQYNITIGIILLWGFLVNTIMCVFFQDTFCNLNPTMVLIGYFVVALAGIGMNEFSDNPIVSFIGYNLVVLPVGVVLSICLKDYYMSSIVQAFILTTLITIVLIIVSSIKPEIFLSMGKTLFICLSAVIVIEFIMILFGNVPKWWDWIVALLFCGYIGYDWAEAQNNAKTLDNAIDSAVALYLDIINLFLRLLGSSKDDD